MQKNEARPHALAELVRHTLDTQGASYGDVQRRGGIPKATIAKLATGPLTRSPKPETLVGLARGLSLPVSVIQAAVAEALGYSKQENVDDATRDVVAMLNEMSDADRKVAAALVSSYYRSRGE